ncbi:hypothetical protein ACVWZ6_002728 [Bradyrhizobium sp. GM6.1]
MAGNTTRSPGQQLTFTNYSRPRRQHYGQNPNMAIARHGLVAIRSYGSEPRHHHVFDLDILIQAMMRTFATEATFLDTAEGRDFRGDQARVDTDHAGFKCLGDAPDAAEIA